MNSPSRLGQDPDPKSLEEGGNLSERKRSLRRYSKPEEGRSETEKIGRTGEGCKMTPEAFQELLEARAAQMKIEAEEKRQRGIGRLAGMNSKVGINPLELFPKEIWNNMILGALKDPEARGNMCKIHDVFHGLLERDMIRDVLFPLVVDHKIPFTSRHLILPPAGRHRKQNLKQLLNLRLVSKSLRDSVDKWIQDHLLQIMRNSEPRCEDMKLKLNEVLLEMPENLEHLRRILAFSNGPVEQRPRNFFLRSLSVNISPYRPGTQWRRRHQRQEQQLPLCFVLLRDYITELLEKIGDQILCFNFSLDTIRLLVELGVPLSLPEIYKMLRKWLLLMPNLKWLALKTFGMQMQSRSFQLNWMGDAFKDIENEPMPTLRELERLDLWETSPNNVQIWNCVLSANPHVKYLYHCGGDIGDVSVYTTPSVLSMSLENATFGTSGCSGCDFPVFFPKISENKWNLKRLTLWVDFRDAPVNSITSVFEFLEKFPTLEDLELHVNNVKIGDEINFLRLPNLKNLKMEIGPTVRRREECQYFFSLQFLLQCRKLERLAWNNRMPDSQTVQRLMDRLNDEEEEEEGMIDFKGGVVDLWDSNIWDVFPKLRSVKVNIRTKPWVSGRQLSSQDEKWIYSRK